MYEHCRLALDWDFTPRKIDSIIAAHHRTIEQLMDEIATVPLDEATFETVVAPLALAENDAPITPITAVEFLRHVSPDRALRSASDKVKRKWGSSRVSGRMPAEVIRRLDIVYETIDHAALEPEDRRILLALHKVVRSPNRDFPHPEATRLRDIRNRLNALETSFTRNVNEATMECLFTRKELFGVSRGFLANLESRMADDQTLRYVVNVNRPEGKLVMCNAQWEATRREVSLAKGRQCPENIAIMEETVSLRHEAAQLMGYSNHAEKRLEGTLAQNPERVNDFLTNLRDRLIPLGQVEIETLKSYKRMAREELGSDVISDDDTIYDWDPGFLINYTMASQAHGDYNTIKQYYPAESVID
ncbi:metalloendopeptidase, partial [Dimargaris cristalligena]